MTARRGVWTTGLAALLLPPYAVAAPRIEIVASRSAIDSSRPDVPHVEPWLTTAPGDPAHVLAGAIVVGADRDRPWHCAAFVSRNGGRSWLRNDFAMERCIDPWLLPLGERDVLFTGIEIQRGHEAEQRLRLVAFRSPDGGETWDDTAIDLGRGHDHAMLTRTTGGDILVVSQRTRRVAGRPVQRIGVLRSTDGGRSFVEHRDLSPSNLALVPTGLAWLTGGRLIVSFLDSRTDPDGSDPDGALRQPRAWALRSDDGGRTFSEPLFVAEECGPTDGFSGYPALAVDRSRRYRDRIYHACVRARFDGLALAVSDDGGESWSRPVRVARGDEAHVRTPMLAVNRDGVVVLAWYDRSDDPERACQDVFVTASFDGGATFVDDRRVTDETSCPRGPGNGGVADAWAMGGDYGSLTAAADGAFHLLWSDSRSGVFQIHHALMSVDADE